MFNIKSWICKKTAPGSYRRLRKSLPPGVTPRYFYDALDKNKWLRKEDLKRQKVEKEKSDREHVECIKEQKEKEDEYKSTKKELEGKEVCFNCKYVNRAFDEYSMNHRKCARHPPVHSVTYGKYGVSHHNNLPEIYASASCGEFVKKLNQ